MLLKESVDMENMINASIWFRWMKKKTSSLIEDKIRSLFITPDLTPLEQKKHKALRQQLADMNKSENVYMIKNGKIVRRNT